MSAPPSRSAAAAAMCPCRAACSSAVRPHPASRWPAAAPRDPPPPRESRRTGNARGPRARQPGPGSGWLGRRPPRTLPGRSVGAAAPPPPAGRRRRDRRSSTSMSGSAPRASSRRMASTRSRAAAKMSGVWPQAFSRAFTSAPRSSNAAIAATLPDAAARCSGAGPARARQGRRVGPGREEHAPTASPWPAVGRHVQRRVVADARRRVHRGAGVDQRPGHLRVVPLGGPVQGRHSVAVRAVGVLASRQQGSHRRKVARTRRVGYRCRPGSGLGAGRGRRRERRAEPGPQDEPDGEHGARPIRRQCYVHGHPPRDMPPPKRWVLVSRALRRRLPGPPIRRLRLRSAPNQPCRSPRRSYGADS